MNASCHITELGHTADVGFHLRADSLAELFTCAVEALFQIMRGGPAEGGVCAERLVSLESTEVETLLVDWLSELLYLFETTHAVFTADIQTITPTRLQAAVTGRPLSHPPDVHVKAITYHQLLVQEVNGGWEAQVFVDI